MGEDESAFKGTEFQSEEVRTLWSWMVGRQPSSESRFSPSIVWIPGFEVRQSGQGRALCLDLDGNPLS